VNEEWLADKSRFAVDGLKRRRLDSCWVRRDGKLQKATWEEAFGAIAAKIKGVSGIVSGGGGHFGGCREHAALKELMAHWARAIWIAGRMARSSIRRGGLLHLQYVDRGIEDAMRC